MEEPTWTVNIRDVNPHVVCSLCAGYYIEATTITECLHTFCKSCIVKYLQSSSHCPLCNVKIHETQPLFYLRADRTLQDIVYKLIPGLFESEEKRREEFYKTRTETKDGTKESPVSGLPDEHQHKYDERICLCLERSSHEGFVIDGRSACIIPLEKKFIRCSIRVLVYHLRKMLYTKLQPPRGLELELSCDNEILDDEMSMKQVYLMHWYEQHSPMMIFYRLQRDSGKA